MKILLKRLKLKDWYSHKETVIEFEENTKLSVEGESGAGKSAILEAITFALYGEARTDSKSVVRSGCKKAVVTLEITNGESNVVIERSMTSAGKHSLEVLVDGVASPLTGIKELQGWIEKDLIGASYLLFVNSIAYMQNPQESFVSQTAARRKELLLEIVKAENYDEYYEKAKESLNTIYIQKTALEMQVLSLKVEIAVAEKLIDSEGDLNTSIGVIKVTISALETKKEELLKFIAKYEEADKNVKLCEDRAVGSEHDVKRASEALESLRTQLKALDTLTFDLEAYDALRSEIEAKNDVLEGLDSIVQVQMVREKEKNAYLLTRPLRLDMSSTIARLEERIKELGSRDQCPSGTACPHQFKTSEEILENTKQIAEYVKEEIDRDIQIGLWEEGLKAFADVVDNEKLFLSIKEKREEMSLLAQKFSDMTTIQTKMESLSATRNQLPALEENLKIRTVARDTATRELDEMRKKFTVDGLAEKKDELAKVTSELVSNRERESSVTSQLMVIEQTRKDLGEKNGKLHDIEENLLPDLSRNFNDVSLVKTAFGSSGVKSVIIDYLLTSLQEKINVVLSQLSDITVHLDTQQSKADGEGSKEGLFITICLPDGSERDYLNLSGGERVKVSVAIAEAFGSMQNVGFKIMDEAITALDNDSLDSFLLTLEYLQNQYPQVLAISHIQGVQDAFEEKLLVVKKNGVSIIQ